MMKLGLIGYPLGHSLSPSMHNAALAELKIEGSYVLLETPPESLEERVNSLKEEGFKGFNVTIPHKVAIMQYLDSIDDFAKSVGAVNTVVVDENKKLHGYNTDVYGFMTAIPEEWRKNLKGKNAAVIGSGGAARAILAGLKEIGIQKINVFGIDEAEAAKLKENFDFYYSPLNSLSDLSEFSIVINATPLGMQGKLEGISPLSEELVNSLPDDAVIYDIVYKPEKTKLIEIAEKRGLKTLCGLEMLLLQGVKGFELWTNKIPPVDIMRNALIQNLK